MNAPSPLSDSEGRRLWLSDLVDGRLGGDALTRGCASWANDDEARRTWHAYHLIGDVLRSDELARHPAGDRALLLAVRERLRGEAIDHGAAGRGHGRVVPLPMRSGGRSFGALRRRLRWGGTAAVAAGFVAVAGVAVVMRSGEGPVEVSEGAFRPFPVAAPSVADEGAGTIRRAASGASAIAAALPASAMLRDARLDEYLRAHREALAGSPVALPGGALRSVDFDAAAAR